MRRHAPCLSQVITQLHESKQLPKIDDAVRLHQDCGELAADCGGETDIKGATPSTAAAAAATTTAAAVEQPPAEGGGAVLDGEALERLEQLQQKREGALQRGVDDDRGAVQFAARWNSAAAPGARAAADAAAAVAATAARAKKTDKACKGAVAPPGKGEAWARRADAINLGTALRAALGGAEDGDALAAEPELDAVRRSGWDMRTCAAI